MRHKKTVWSVASVLSLALGQTVLAADLPQRPYTAPPPMIAPAPTWTGCYAGGNIGGAFGNASLSVAGPIGNGTISGNNSGFAGGGQIGCDYDFGGGWVIGFRDMFDGTTNSSSGTFPSVAFPGFAASANFKNQWFDTLTARLGYAFQPAWLLYVQGGFAWAQTTTNVLVAGFQTGQGSSTRGGWTVGGGVEWMFAPHWSAFIEGNYMSQGSNSGTVVTPNLAVCSTGCAWNTNNRNESTVLVGVNFRFF